MKNFGGKETNKGKEKSRFLTGRVFLIDPLSNNFSMLCVNAHPQYPRHSPVTKYLASNHCVNIVRALGIAEKNHGIRFQ